MSAGTPGDRPGPPGLSHVDASGRARMVDVGDKAVTSRRAVARGRVRLGAAAFAAVRDATLVKGDALAVARLAGIQGAKETARLVPLCHPVALSDVEVRVELDPAALGAVVTASARAEGRTGVEMEALTAVAVAALTLYDMAKAVSKDLVIEEIVLLEKSGGRSGDWRRDETGGAS